MYMYRVCVAVLKRVHLLPSLFELPLTAARNLHPSVVMNAMNLVAAGALGRAGRQQEGGGHQGAAARH